MAIDGTVQGETPLDLTDLAPGEHRITVSKAGYLENSRLINLEAGLWETVEIQLTRAPEGAVAPTTPSAPIQVPSGGATTSGGGGGGGGGNAALWLIPVLGGAGAAAAFALSGSDDSSSSSGTTMPTPPTTPTPTPTPTNRAPNAGNVNITPNRVGLSGQTAFTISHSGFSDPDGDSLTCTWSSTNSSATIFPTGCGGSTAVTWTTAGTGIRTVPYTVTVDDGQALTTALAGARLDPLATDTATRSLQFTSANGAWSGSINNLGITFNLNITQRHDDRVQLQRQRGERRHVRRE